MIYSRLLLITCAFISFELIAQDTLMYEDFQTQSLGVFRTVDNDMQLMNPEFTGFNGEFNIVPVAGPDDFRAIGVSYFIDETAAADNWLISPMVPITSAGTFLRWKASSLSGEADRLDAYRVVVSPTGSDDLEDFTTVLYEQAEENFEQTERSLDLSAFVGQTIRIAFNQVGVNNYALTLDDILVQAPSAATSIVLLDIKGDRYQELNTSSLSLELVNNGSEVITSLTAAGSINGMSGDFLFEDLNIASQDTVLIPFADLFPFEADKYEIITNIIAVNGIDFTTDTITKTVFMIADAPQRPFVYEEATSTNCGWCPEGLVRKDVMIFKYGDAVLPISVHTDDPMRNVAYDLGIQNQEGFLGFPSASVNREANLTHEAVEPYFLDVFNATAPLTMDLQYEYDEASRVLKMSVSSTAHTTLDSSLHRYSFLILEDDVTGTTPDYAQANNFSFEASNIDLNSIDNINWRELNNPVPAGMMSYDDVLREVIGGYDGLIASIPMAAQGDIIGLEQEYVIPSPFNAQNISIVALVIDVETGAILNAIQKDIDFESRTDEQQSVVSELKIYPNPAQNKVFLSVNALQSTKAKISVLNSQGATVLSITKPLLVGQQEIGLELNDLHEGIYQLTVNAGKDLVSRRLVVMPR